MLLEALNFLATMAISPRRRAAEVNSSVRLWARARRCARDWGDHEAHCHEFVRGVVARLDRRRVVVVLGSGLLRDVPIADLSREFEEVRLYDLQHLASVRAWAALKGLRNLSFISHDLTEQMRFPAEDDRIDFVISANLLSQLGVNAVRQGLEPSPVIGEHLRALSAVNCPVCLLTDTSFSIIGRDGTVLDNGDLMHGVEIGTPVASWDWTVAPYGELDPAYKAVHRVNAIIVRPLPVDQEPASP